MVEAKDVTQANNFVYLGGNKSDNGRVDVEVRRRIQTGARGRSWIPVRCQLVHMAWRR